MAESFEGKMGNKTQTPTKTQEKTTHTKEEVKSLDNKNQTNTGRPASAKLESIESLEQSINPKSAFKQRILFFQSKIDEQSKSAGPMKNK